MSTTPVPTPVSDEYPKWLRKSGARDIQVRSATEEAAQREVGFSHEVIVAEQQPPLGSVQPTAVLKNAAAAAAVAPAGGTVATAVLDQMLEAQRARFDAQWERKCEEVRTLKKELTDLQDNHLRLVDALEIARKTNAELIDQSKRTVLAEVPKGTDAAPAESAGSPLKPPVAAKKG